MWYIHVYTGIHGCSMYIIYIVHLHVYVHLCSRLAAAEEDLHTSQGGVDQLRSEFTKRISTTEKKLQIVIKVWIRFICDGCKSYYILSFLKERDSLKKQLQVLTAEHSHQ